MIGEPRLELPARAGCKGQHSGQTAPPRVDGLLAAARYSPACVTASRRSNRRRPQLRPAALPAALAGTQVAQVIGLQRSAGNAAVTQYLMGSGWGARAPAGTRRDRAERRRRCVADRRTREARRQPGRPAGDARREPGPCPGDRRLLRGRQRGRRAQRADGAGVRAGDGRRGGRARCGRGEEPGRPDRAAPGRAEGRQEARQGPDEVDAQARGPQQRPRRRRLQAGRDQGGGEERQLRSDGLEPGRQASGRTREAPPRIPGRTRPSSSRSRSPRRRSAWITSWTRRTIPSTAPSGIRERRSGSERAPPWPSARRRRAARRRRRR